MRIITYNIRYSSTADDHYPSGHYSVSADIKI
jgi:hypothetical protein